MYTTTDKKEALRLFELEGGYLLDLGEHTYCVCDEEMAIDMGRSKEHLESLAPTYSEIDIER